MMTWTYEHSAEDEPAMWYIRNSEGQVVAEARDEDWAKLIVAALNRDEAAFRERYLSKPVPEIRF